MQEFQVFLLERQLPVMLFMLGDVVAEVSRWDGLTVKAQ